MKKRIVIGLILLMMLVAMAGCQFATHERNITQTPETLQPATGTQPAVEIGATASPKEKTIIWSLLHWGQTPAKTISTIGPMEAPKPGSAKMGGFKTLKDAARGPVILIVIGAIAVLAGAAAFIWISKPTGLAAAAGGGALIGVGLLVEAYPWAILLVPVMAVAAGVWFIFGTKRGKQLREQYGLTTEALRSTVKAVDIFKHEHPDVAKPLSDVLRKEQDGIESDLIDEMRV